MKIPHSSCGLMQYFHGPCSIFSKPCNILSIHHICFHPAQRSLEVGSIFLYTFFVNLVKNVGGSVQYTSVVLCCLPSEQTCRLFAMLLKFTLLKGACFDPQPHPPTFFQTYEDVGTIFRRLCEWCEILWAISVYCRRNQQKSAWKLKNMISTIYKTINNRNIVFSNCLQMRYIFAFLFHHEWYIGWKSDHICQFKENLFSKDFGPGTFKRESAMFSITK